VDRLRKIGFWLWFQKERIILAVIVGILVYRVYMVANPPAPPEEAPLVPPKTKIDESVPPEVRPPVPQPKPPGSVPGNYAMLFRKNPFWYYGGTQQAGGSSEVTPESLGIALLDLKQVNGRWRAQLRTRSTTKWYDEGEQFEEFELQSISPEERSVTVYAVRHAKRFVLKLPERKRG